ncbi:YccT family protein [Duffyella gerundensis]|jgi:uncharacterized protein YccT (UPF0319 family)|uniref:Uncharacterized protein n=1 Tax=Duffyella gerundensis TaxID=1619313 RepID=A0A0U5L4H1_9GAMM|nr:DUF2057 family protein [Duffyella gerundensis]QTO53059.1 DUF2057 family protein [Duffyella gerundensis]CUU23571.1 hypothetical protein EM595_1337 [Duffyella gerundensis]
MNLRLAFVGLMALLLSAPTLAITLKLHPDIDLLVLDGRKISGSLLKGADGLELERGEHQFLFRIDKTLSHESSKKSVAWRSDPLIVTFKAEAKTISIQLPAFRSVAESRRFEKTLAFKLVDEKGNEIASRRDHLPTMPDGNLEQALMTYNGHGKVASVARFARPVAAQLPQPALPDELVYRDNHTSRVLHLWLEQVDLATRQRLLLWMKAPRTS